MNLSFKDITPVTTNRFEAAKVMLKAFINRSLTRQIPYGSCPFYSASYGSASLNRGAAYLKEKRAGTIWANPIRLAWVAAHADAYRNEALHDR